jgi:hypothetical protein
MTQLSFDFAIYDTNMNMNTNMNIKIGIKFKMDMNLDMDMITYVLWGAVILTP